MYTYPAWFHNPTEDQIVVVGSPHSVPKDPDTEEEFPDLTLRDMRESDDWFEYASRDDLQANGF